MIWGSCQLIRWQKNLKLGDSMSGNRAREIEDYRSATFVSALKSSKFRVSDLTESS